MRAVLCCVQRAAIEHQPVSGKSIADTLGLSNNVVQRYLRALRESGHVAFVDGRCGTIHVKEWS